MGHTASRSEDRRTWGCVAEEVHWDRLQERIRGAVLDNRHGCAHRCPGESRDPHAGVGVRVPRDDIHGQRGGGRGSPQRYIPRPAVLHVGVRAEHLRGTGARQTLEGGQDRLCIRIVGDGSGGRAVHRELERTTDGL